MGAWVGIFNSIIINATWIETYCKQKFVYSTYKYLLVCSLSTTLPWLFHCWLKCEVSIFAVWDNHNFSLFVNMTSNQHHLYSSKVFLHSCNLKHASSIKLNYLHSLKCYTCLSALLDCDMVITFDLCWLKGRSKVSIPHRFQKSVQWTTSTFAFELLSVCCFSCVRNKMFFSLQVSRSKSDQSPSCLVTLNSATVKNYYVFICSSACYMQKIAFELLRIVSVTRICNKIVKETSTMVVSVPFCSIHCYTAWLKTDLNEEPVEPLLKVWRSCSILNCFRGLLSKINNAFCFTTNPRPL